MTPLSDHRTSTRPTMADVAAEAHVSVKTVSRVVNREAGVRTDTAERVRAVIERLGFRRHDGARLMRQGRTSTIALVVEDLANPFYSQISAAVEREARIRQHQLITASAEGSPTRERAVIDALIDRRVDGIVVVPADEVASSDPAIEASNTPVVYVDRPVRGLERDTVLSDNLGGVRSAVEHLVAHGHRGIGFFGDDPAFWTARQRREAFVSTSEALGLPTPTRIAMGPHTTASVRETIARWSSPDGATDSSGGHPGTTPVTAVITGNNRITLEVLVALRELRLPLGLVGYDDFELADLVDPPVTVVHQDPAAMGQKAAQQLFARLLGDESAAHTVVMPTRLVVRASGTRRALSPTA